MFLNKLFKSEKKEPNVQNRRASKPRTATSQKTRKQHVKISAQDLRMGMRVTELDKPWEESSFMFQGINIESASDILAIQKECSFVYVDYDEMSLKEPETPSSSDPVSTASVTTATTSVREELAIATKLHGLASRAVNNVFQEIKLGGELDGKVVKKAVNGCVDSIMRNQDASLWLTRIQDKDASTAQHSMNVSAFSIILGKAMELTPSELEDLGVCGMLHDVGKTKISSDILEKAGPLTPAETAEMQMHTTYGRDILLNTQDMISGAADVAYTHHEQPDGRGFPNQLTGESIPLYAKIVAIAEAYDNMTMNQAYRSSLPPSQALQELYAKRGKQFDEELVVLFIDSIGIFPPGSIVEMVNKEIGIVLANTKDKLRPRVIMILDQSGEPATQRVIDLSRLEVDNEGNAYQVKTTHSDGSFGICVGEFQRAGLRIG